MGIRSVPKIKLVKNQRNNTLDKKETGPADAIPALSSKFFGRTPSEKPLPVPISKAVWERLVPGISREINWDSVICPNIMRDQRLEGYDFAIAFNLGLQPNKSQPNMEWSNARLAATIVGSCHTVYVVIDKKRPNRIFLSRDEFDKSVLEEQLIEKMQLYLERLSQ